MVGYTKRNLREVEDQAPRFGLPSGLGARFVPTPLGGKMLGLSLLTLAPGFRIPFGHTHTGQEEVYVVVRGSGRITVEDEIVDVAAWDAMRFDKNTMRNVEAGADGIEFVAFAAGDDPLATEMAQDWWPE